MKTMLLERRKLLKVSLALALIALIGGFYYLIAEAETEDVELAETTRIVYGGRLQSDTLFYAQIGAKNHIGDVMLGIGWNDAIWVGAHGYFLSSDGFAAFSGLEAHIRYPSEGTLEFHPSLAIGFAVEYKEITVIIETLLLPSSSGEPIDALLAVSFLFNLP